MIIKRQRRIIGAFIKIELENHYHTYGRILSDCNYAIYDCRTGNNEEVNLEEIASKHILFITGTYDQVITKGRWTIVGILPLEEYLQQPPAFFAPYIAEPNKYYRIYINGAFIEATREEILHLEALTAWSPEEIEERINDYYAGRKMKS